MLNFELNRIKREIQRYGNLYEIKRRNKNEFGEDVLEETQVKIIKGIYHEVSSSVSVHISLTNTDGGNYSDNERALILCLFEDSDGIKQDDFLNINNKTYRINGVKNIANFSLVAEISLELVL